MKNNTVIFPGSFDPFTNGHVNLVQRALSLFDHVRIAVVSKGRKHTLFSLEERINLAEQACACFGQAVIVEGFSGLLVDYARSCKCRAILRGLRAISDFDYETQMALINKRLYPELETVYLAAREDNLFVSSSVVREIGLNGGPIEQFVPSSIAEELHKGFLLRQGTC